MIHDVKTDKPRGYAFIEYEDESSMHGKSIILYFFYLLISPLKNALGEILLKMV